MTLHDPAHLLDHAAWLRSLAQSLVGDRATADDLVQDTYVAALRRPPSTDRSVKPWLSRVLRNAARFRWRSETNRTAREAALASTSERETLTSAELLERHETQQLLARLVGELEEPYRETILLRFAEGLAPKDIARRLGIPAGTVRWRISEGLARLRARLDALHDGDRKAWLAALAPLASRAPVAGVPIAIVAALVAIAAIVLVFAVRRHHDATDVAAVPARAPATRHVPAAAAASPPAMAWRAQPGAPRRRIAGRVIIDGATTTAAPATPVPAAGVLVTLTQDGAVRERRTDHEGRFDFGLADASEHTVSASAPGKVATIVHVDARDPRASTDSLEIALTPCVASLWGFVRDAEGAPISGARVLREDVFGAESDATGAYEVCALPTATELAQLLFTVRADGYGAIHALPAPKGRVRRDFILTPEATITGRVLDDAGEPIANARVMVAADSNGTQAYDDIPAPATATTDATGAFQIGGVRGGRVQISAEAANAIASPVFVVASSGETRTVTLHAQATGSVHGRVLVGAAPAAGARVTVRGTPELAAVAQADGSFVLPRIPAGHVELDVAGYKALQPVALDVRAAAEAAIEIAVAPLVTVRGVVRSRGVVVPHARVGYRGAHSLGATADAFGAYVIAGLEPGSYELHADDTRMGAYVDGPYVVPDVSEHVHDIDLTASPRVSGRVVDPQGAPVAGAFVAFLVPGSSGEHGHCVTAADGAFDCGQMDFGGSYQPAVFASETMRMPLPFAVPPPSVPLLDGRAVVENVRLVVERQDLAIDGRLVDVAGAPISDAVVQLGATDHDRARWAPLPRTITNAAGAFRIGGLVAGEYTVEVQAQEGARAWREHVPAGTTGLAISMDRSTCDGGGAVRDRMREEPPGIAARPPGPTRWDERIELVGWTLPARVKTGEPFEAVFVYRVLRPLDRSWTVFGHFLGAKWINTDHEPMAGRCPTRMWRAGDVIVDRFSATLPVAGRYELAIGFYAGSAARWTNLPVSAAPPGSTRDDEGIRAGIVTAE